MDDIYTNKNYTNMAVENLLMSIFFTDFTEILLDGSNGSVQVVSIVDIINKYDYFINKQVMTSVYYVFMIIVILQKQVPSLNDVQRNVSVPTKMRGKKIVIVILIQGQLSVFISNVIVGIHWLLHIGYWLFHITPPPPLIDHWLLHVGYSPPSSFTINITITLMLYPTMK